MEIFCDSSHLYNLVKENTCFKDPPKCYDLILTNKKHNFQNTIAITTGFSDFHKMTTTDLKTEFVKADPIKIEYSKFKFFNHTIFREDLHNKLYEDASSAEELFEDYHKFQDTVSKVLNKHATIKKKYLRANNSPFMTSELWKMIMNRSRCKNAYFKNKTIQNWEKYCKLRNEYVKYTKKH